MQKILFVEDDVNLGLPVAGALEDKGYGVKYLTSGSALKEEMAVFEPDLLLLDVNLNEQFDGFDLARQIRFYSNIPVIFTTSRTENDDFEQGFAISNMDYVRKPYRLAELLKRVERMWQSSEPVAVFRLGIFTFNSGEYSLQTEGNKQQLNHYEAEVLHELCNCRGQFIDRATLIQKIWKVSDPKLKDGSLNNVLSQLRKYMAADSSIQIESRAKLGVMLMLN